MSSESSGEANHSQTNRFDFDRLEQSVETLLKDHDRLQAEREALMAELADREHRVTRLQSQLDDERQRRQSALECVDRVLARLVEVEASVETGLASVRPSAEASGSATKKAGRS